MSHQPTVVRVRTATLEIACEVSGPERGTPVILLHGFPDDPRTWDRVAAHLSRAGYRTIAPYLRGYGPTRFLDEHTLRSGQQAALGHDLLALMDGLGIQRAVLAGYDWGGRAACVVSALWPHRARALVSIGGYNVLNVAANAKPAPPVQEHRLWYQWYFATERGRAGLAANRREFCKLLWRLWSPNWRFDDATYERTAASFDNPDFVDVSFTPTATASAGRPAIRAWSPARSGWPRGRASACPPSCCMAAPTAWPRRTARPGTRGFSAVRTCGG